MTVGNIPNRINSQEIPYGVRTNTGVVSLPDIELGAGNRVSATGTYDQERIRIRGQGFGNCLSCAATCALGVCIYYMATHEA